MNFNYTTYFLLIVSASLYIALLFFGQDTNGYGTTAWIRIGSISLQLTDFAKITAILFYSSLFSARKTYSNRSILILSSVFFIINFIGSVLIHELGSFYILYFLHLSMLYIFMEKGRKKENLSFNHSDCDNFFDYNLILCSIRLLRLVLLQET